MYGRNGKPTGIDVQIMQAIARVLGVRLDWVNSSFSALIPGIQAGRYTVYVNAVTITAIRLKGADFVQYLKNIGGLLVEGGNPHHIKSDLSLCGLTAALTEGSVNIAEVQGYSKACLAKGRKAITIETTDSDPSSILAVESGRADFFSSGYVTCSYVAKEVPSKLMALPDPGSAVVPLGIVLKKGDTALEQEMDAALRIIMANGVYQGILRSYGDSDLAISKPFIFTKSSQLIAHPSGY
jgi:polar amino acid transport system substrate-binding protein